MELDRLKLLEQKVQVMQEEVNSVLQEVQVAMQGMARANKMAFEVLIGRLQKLEELSGVAEARKDTDGKEL